MASKFAKGANCGVTEKGPRFYGVDNPGANVPH
jgi:hypothetical protein